MRERCQMLHVQFDSPDDGPAGPKHVEKIVNVKRKIKVYQVGKETKYLLLNSS